METPKPNTKESNESVEKYGRNVTLNISLIRHGEKNSKVGELTEAGKEAAREFGEGRNSKVYHSDVHRNKQTAEEIAANSQYNPRLRKGLAVSAESQWYDKYFAMVQEGGMYDETKAIQKLQFDIGRENRPDGMVSSKEVSAQVAKELVHFLDMSKKLKNNSEVTLDLVSHTGIIEHVLIDLLDGDPENFLEEIGGGMRYLEGPKIKIVREDRDNALMYISFDREFSNDDGSPKRVSLQKTMAEEELRLLAGYTHKASDDE